MAPSCQRGVLSCARCRKRKIKCDRLLPECSQCQVARADCKGYDSVNEVEVPRSVVQHLEDEIARMEKELGRVDHSEVSDAIVAGQGKDLLRGGGLYSPIATPRVNSLASIPSMPSPPPTTMRDIILASPALQAMVQATMPSEPRFADLLPRVRMGLTPSFILSSSARDDVQRGSTTVRTVETGPDFNILLGLPPDVVRSLVKKYTLHSLPMNPILYEPTIWEQVDRVLARLAQMMPGHPSSQQPVKEDYDFLIIYLILAISATLGAAQSGHEARCLAYSAALFKEGVQHLSSKAPFPDDLAGVQATLLILQYAFINPLCANVWVLSGAAMRSCLELGLHRDISMVKGMNPLLMDLRRRVFWVAYVMDRSICSTLQRPLSIPDPAIDAQYPSILDDYCITANGLDSSGRPTKLPCLRWIEYSRLQSIMTEVHFQGTQIAKHQVWDDWLQEMEQKLRAWYDSTTNSLTDETEWAFMHGLMSLHRPSPRAPMPESKSLLVAYESACKSARAYRQHITTGISRRPWLAAHHTLESALVVLFCLRHNHRGISEKFSAQEIFESTKIFTTNLLAIASQGWSAISKYAGIYERLLGPLLEAVFTGTESSLLFTPAQDAELAELLYPGPAHLPSLRTGMKFQTNNDPLLFDASLFEFNYSFLEGNGDLMDFFQVDEMPPLVEGTA